MTIHSLSSVVTLCLVIVFFSSCSVLSSQYSYNSSRGTGEPEPTTQPTTKPKSEDNKQEDYVDFEEEEEDVKDEVIEENTSKEEEVVTEETADFSDEEKLRKDIVDYAHDYLGTDYVYGGKTPDGFDCSGFTCHVMKKYDVKLPPVSASQAKEGKKVKMKNARPGDLVFFRKTPAGKVFHVALVVDNDKKEGLKVIHSTSRGVVVDNISKSDYWRPKISIVRDVLEE
ncbi:MAG: C40 family peptidase [Chitinophagales bacterium]|nr:C40 family peptidase [Chitinophagales bacterium]